METPDIKRSPYYFSIRRPVTVTMLILTSVVFGMLSYRLLPVNLMPEINYPSLTVRTEYPGAAPEEVEITVTRPLEQALGVVRHLVEMKSSSRAEFSDILMEFDWGTDMNQATQNVREKLDLVFLPEDVKQPLVLRYDPSLDPLMRIGLTSDSLSLMELRQLCEDLVKREIDKLPGVAAVKVKGGVEDEVRIEIDAGKLNLMNLSVEQLTQKLVSENINVAGGRLLEGETEFIIRSLNEFSSIEAISQIIIAIHNGSPIRLRDVARVEKTGKERTSLTRVLEKESVELEIYKESDANPIDVSEIVNKRFYGWQDKHKNKGNHRNRGGIKTLSEMLTHRVQVYTLSDQSKFISQSVQEVKFATLLGGILAVVVLFLFLGRFWDTFIIGIVIPISIICAFAAMHMVGVSLNVMSLGGLALGIGMMVDNAIVVIESIHRRREQGDDPVTSAVSGTRIVGTAVTASTLTTVVVFFPVVFVTGIAGQVFGDMALTVIIALVTSLIVALFFIPMLVVQGENFSAGGHRVENWQRLRFKFGVLKESLNRGLNAWKSRKKIPRILLSPFFFIYLILLFILGIVYYSVLWVVGWLAWFLMYLHHGFIRKIIRYLVGFTGSGSGAFQNAVSHLTSRYMRLMRNMLAVRWIFPFVMVLLCYVSFGWILPKMGGELIPSVSQGTFDVEFTLPVGSSLDKTAAVTLPIEQYVSEMEEVSIVSSRAGIDVSGSDRSEFGTHISAMTVMLNAGGDIEAREKLVVGKIRHFTAGIPSLAMLVTHPTLFTFKQPIEIIIKGDNLDDLRKITNAVEKRLQTIDVLADIESSIRAGHPEIVIRFDRDRLSRLGLSARKAAERIKAAIHGTVPTRYRERERRIDIRVQWEEKNRKTIDNLRTLVINPDQPVPVTLEEVAGFEIREGPAEISHHSGVRSAMITAAVSGSDLKTADEEIKKVMSAFNLDEGYDYSISGQRREMKESLGSLRLALLLSIFLVYVVMASQFESLKSPFLILLTIPFGVACVLPVLWGFGTPLSIMVFLGLIVLAGIVVNNSIVLVDYISHLRRSGSDLDAAITEAAGARLRPILMTSLTTILALIPMAVGIGEGAEIRKPMAITVIFGLTFATVITLVVIPVFYRLLNKDRPGSGT